MITIDFVTDEEKEHIPSRSFKMKPMEIRNAIIAYLESVPTQEAIEAAGIHPKSVVDSRTKIAILAEDIKVWLERHPIEGVEGFWVLLGADSDDGMVISHEAKHTQLLFKKYGRECSVELRRFNGDILEALNYIKKQ